MNAPAVHFDHVSKAYALHGPGNPFPAAWRAWRRSPSSDALWALRDIHQVIAPGEILGIIGANGAGKSTLLKLMAGVTAPTEGALTLRGRVSSLIELGAGFHPELTGRENVFLNGQIMGLSRRSIQQRYHAIVAFAGLGDFMDVPVKRYSSGMYARLGFAVAAHLDPEILLVDEVLSVGDASFQRRSLARMLELVNSGKTVIFVSHNLLAVERLCRQVWWLDHGRVRAAGPARSAIQAYLVAEEVRFAGGASAPAAGQDVTLQQVALCDGQGRRLAELRTGEDLLIELVLKAAGPVDRARLNLGIADARGVLFLANMLLDGRSIALQTGANTVRCRFRQVPLMPGAYSLMGEVWGAAGYDVRLPWSEWARLRVVLPADQQPPPASDYSVTHLHADAPFSVRYDWQLDTHGEVIAAGEVGGKDESDGL